MKTTDKFKETGPVFAAQYMHVFQPADKSNPYDQGTWEHKAFDAEMAKLERESFTAATPQGMAWSDYVEGVNNNPYMIGSEDWQLYEDELMSLVVGEKK